MIKSILLAIDLNHESSWRKAMPQAVALAQANGAGLHVMTVVPSFGMSLVGSYFPSDFEEKAEAEAMKALDALVAREVPAELGAKTHVTHGTIYKKIIEIANKAGADLIVMAAARSEMQDYLLGPNAARVVRHARQSVFVVRE